MNSKLIQVLKLYLNHIKRDIAFCYIFILISFIVIRNFNIPESISFFLILLMFIFNIYTIKNFSFHPGNKSTNIDSFNWKYLFNLPLSFREKLLLLIGIDLISFSHLYFYFILFAKDISRILDITNYNPNIPLILLVLIQISIIHSFIVLKNAWIEPKYQMQKFSNISKNIYILKVFIIFLFLMIGSFFLLCFLINYSVFTDDQVVNVLKSFGKSLITWPIFIYLLIFIIYEYFLILKYFTVEKYNYIEPEKYSIKKNLIHSLIFFAIGTIAIKTYINSNFNYSELIDKNPLEARQFLAIHKDQINKNKGISLSPIQAIIHKGNVELLNFAIKNGGNLNFEYKKENDFHDGFTASYFAIDSNNLEMIKSLTKIGVSFGEKSKGATFYPIHLVFNKCKPEVIDYFLDQQFDLEKLNDLGESSLLVALRSNCLYGVLKLKDANANLNAFNLKKEDKNIYINKYIKSSERKAIYKYLLKITP